MNREIKFRVWGKKPGLQSMYYNAYFIPYGEGWNGGNPEYKFYEINFGSGGFMKVAAKEVEIMQYTGLKDKNGKEIYEDDVVNGLTDGEEDTFQIEWHVGKEWSGWEIGRSTECEIIGNIYENPELINK